MESFSPTIAFIMVDFPTFGLPIIFTKPDLCDIDIVILKFLAKIREILAKLDLYLLLCSS
jgi:hypothetical protein